MGGDADAIDRSKRAVHDSNDFSHGDLEAPAIAYAKSPQSAWKTAMAASPAVSVRNTLGPSLIPK